MSGRGAGGAIESLARTNMPLPGSPKPPLRLLVIADVGGEDARHIGDEAMLEANLEGFRSCIPGVAFTVVTRDPEWTAARYGVEAVAPFGFSRHPAAGAERRAMLDDLPSEASDPPRSSTLSPLTALAGADALVVSGGGNLSSTWPDLLYERVALLRLAHILGKPAVVLGQTLGPKLEDEERQVLATALATARFVGVREFPSAVLAVELGVSAARIWYQSDDALLPRSGEPAPSQAIVVTIDAQMRSLREDAFAALATQLRALSETTGAPLTLVPHLFGGESSGASSDLTEALLLAERIGGEQTTIAPGLDAAQVRTITGAAALVISSRYHPIVFGLGAAVPCLGIFDDDYCRIKLEGALTHAGLERWTVTYDDVAQGELLPKALELWRLRNEVRHTLESCQPAWREESRERWSAILRALATGETPSAEKQTLFGRPLEQIAPAVVAAFAAQQQGWQREQDSHARTAARLVQAEGFARYLENESGLRRAARHVRAWLRSR